MENFNINININEGVITHASIIKNPQILVDKLKEQMRSLGIKGAVVGISGGKDSTIVAKLMSDVLGKENVVGVLMPNNVQEDFSDALKVVNFLNIPYFVINIETAFKSLKTAINFNMTRTFNKLLTNAAKINIAPRIRMSILYGVAQSFGSGWRVIGTTNKSEEYIGWLTKWGDGAADFEPIIDFTVTELKELGKNLNLPIDLVNKVPIDGLAKGTDEEKFGFTYEMLDKYIETGTSGNKEVDDKISYMHSVSEHKRNLVPRATF